MRILLDECVPRPIRRSLPPHSVTTVPERGWSGKRNGILLSLMAGQFDVFVTTDRNLRFQQDLRAAGIALITLVAKSNRLADLLPLMPAVHSRLNGIAPGDVIDISSP